MKIIYKTYKFKLEPNSKQKQILAKHFGAVRFVYNYFLNERISQYNCNKKSDNYFIQAKKLTELKQLKEYNWLNEIPCQTLQHSLRHLETSYLNFYRKLTNFPKFKTKKSKNSFSIPRGIKIINNFIFIPKIKQGIKIKLHREIKGTIKSATVSLTPTGKYFVSILTEQLYEPLLKTGEKVGIDLGLKYLLVTSNGEFYKNHKYFKKYQKKLAKAQKDLSRKKYGSNRYENQRLKVAKIYEKISNCRNDTLHKISTDLVKKYDVICLETLPVKKMLKNKVLSKSIIDASWSNFVAMLEYKAKWNNKIISKIDRFYPSSKKCNCCDFINQNLSLYVREWTCPKCNTKHNRDINAAKNILIEGLRNISVGMVDYTDGDEVRLSEQTSKKSEVY